MLLLLFENDKKMRFEFISDVFCKYFSKRARGVFRNNGLFFAINQNYIFKGLKLMEIIRAGGTYCSSVLC